MLKSGKIIFLKKEILNLRGKALEKIIGEFLKKNKKIFCKGLNKRPVFIDEYLYFTNSRNSSDKNHRKQSFFFLNRIIKKSKKRKYYKYKKILMKNFLGI